MQFESKRIKPIKAAIAGFVILTAGGCTNPQPNSPNQSNSPNQPKLQIVTTFVPITQFTKAVAGDRAVVTQLLPPNVGPHDYQSKPEDVQKLAQANVLVQNGLEMETFLEGLIKNAGNQNLQTIDTSQGISTIKDETSHTSDKTVPQKADASHAHGEQNPHIWLDPKRAMQQVENIRDGLITADTAGKEVYTANAATYVTKLKQLDAEITTKLKPFQGKTYVTFHDFSPYFAQSYGLKTEFLVDIPEENPAPNDVKRVIEAAKASGLKTLLSEPQTGEARFKALAQDLNVKISSFDPIETTTPENLQPEGYLLMMRQNLQNLERAFTGP